MKETNNTKIKISDYNSTQFNLNTDIKNQISHYFINRIDSKDLADKKDLPDYAQNRIVTNEAHITVLYGIKENQFDIIKDIVSDKKEVTAILGKTDIFVQTFLNYDVLYLSILSLGIRRLRKELEKKVDHSKSPFSFTPHCTIAYLKKGVSNKYKGNKEFENVIIKFNTLSYSPVDGDDILIKLGG